MFNTILGKSVRVAICCSLALFALPDTSEAALLECSTVVPKGKNNTETVESKLSHATQKLCGTSGNDDGNMGFFSTNPTVFGTDGWELAFKNDGSISGNGEVVLNPVNPGLNSEDTLLDWSVDSFNGYQNVAVALKYGNLFDLYLLNTAETSGKWQTSKGLSHFSIWIQGDPIVTTPVPVPASGLLLVAGVLGFARFRRQKS